MRHTVRWPTSRWGDDASAAQTHANPRNVEHAGVSDDSCRERLSFVGRKLADRFMCTWTTIEPGAETRYEPNLWDGALVVVEEGEIELECLNGDRQRFSRGAVLTLDFPQLRTLRNPGDQPALLSVVSRHDGRSAGT